MQVNEIYMCIIQKSRLNMPNDDNDQSRITILFKLMTENLLKKKAAI